MNNKNQLLELTNYIEELVYNMKLMELTSLDNLNDNINLQELQLIIYLGKSGSKRMNEIANQLQLGMSHITYIVDKLIEKGLVARQRPEDDRRVVNVELSKKGKDVFSRHREQKKDLSKKILQSLNNNEGEMLINIMKKITQAMKP
jgi:DNA-binding MarR family transcriptional regulator